MNSHVPADGRVNGMINRRKFSGLRLARFVMATPWRSLGSLCYIAVLLSSLMDFWHDYPVVKDRMCPRCGKTSVHAMLTTGIKLHLQCQSCGHYWEEPERRRTKPRETRDTET